MASTPRKTTNNKDKRILGTYETTEITFAATKREIRSRPSLHGLQTKKDNQPTTTNGYWEPTKRPSTFHSVQRNETRNKPVLGLHSYETRTYQAQNTATAQNATTFRPVTLLLLRLSVTLRLSVPFGSWRCKDIEIQSKIPTFPKID